MTENMTDFSHLNAIEERLHRAEMRLRGATSDRDRKWFKHEVRMIEREEDAERAFLGMPDKSDDASMTDADLLDALLT